ncbi:hypothetical protein BJ138DRAFT_1014391, partial [Hygrophoropsis aurantiaca]
QTTEHSIIDIATPPSGGLTPFNVYVSLSRGHAHPSEYLRLEDERLVHLDRQTERRWYARQQGTTQCVELPS